MNGGLEGLIARACRRWVDGVARRPVAVLVACGLVTVAAALYAVLTLGVNADPRTLINQQLPFQQRQRDLVETFDTLADGFLVVIDADSAVAAGRAADALGAKLAQRTDLFTQVDVPGGGPFYAKNALLYLEPDQLEDLTDRLGRVQPFLGELARDQTLVGIADLLRQALAAQRDGPGLGLDLSTALDRVGDAVDATTAHKPAADPWSAALLEGAMPAEARQRIVALRGKLDWGSLLNAGPHVEAIRAAADDLGLTPERGIRLRITGDPVLNYEELLAIGRQMQIVAVVSFVLFTVAITLALRSLRVSLALVSSLVVGLVLSNAFAALLIGHLNQISAMVNVLIIGLGGELQIHACMRYLELVRSGMRRRDALLEMADSMGPALFSSSCTTAIGFLIFLFTDFTGVAQLGLISGAGMFLSFAAAFTVVPAVLAAGAPAPVRPPGRPSPIVAWLETMPLRWERPIRWGALAVAVGAVLVIPRVRFDYNLLALRDPSTESVQAFEDLLAGRGRTPWTIDVVAPDLPAARATAKRLAALGTVAEVKTVDDLVPADQDEKREILETASYFVPMEFAAGPARDVAAQRAALAALADEAGRAAKTSKDPKLTAAAERLHASLTRFLERLPTERSPAAALSGLQANVVGSLPEQMRELRPLLTPDTVSLESLPAALKGQMLAADGRARIQVYPREDLNDSRALERFVDDVRTVAPDASGGAVWVVEWGRVTWRAMVRALVIGMGCMLLFLVLLWRSVWDTLLAFFPLALATALTGATLVLTGDPFNFVNVIVLPMLIGMGVDSGVHLVHRHRTRPDEVDVLASSTARAVFFAAVTTVLTFGSLAFASHRGMASFGRLLTVGVALTLVCYVVVLPAVLAWDDRRRRGPGAVHPEADRGHALGAGT